MTDKIIPPRRDWRLKLIEATRGNQTQMGAIVLVSINKEPDNPPYFRGKASITSDGFVMCDFVDKNGTYHMGALVCDDEDLVRNAITLAFHCDLNEEEKTEFLAAVNAWISNDYRSAARIRKVMLVE